MAIQRPLHRSSASHRRLLLLALPALVALLLFGCRGDITTGQPDLAEETEPETGLPDAGQAQPGVGGEPVAGEFAEIPLPTGAQPFAEARVENDVTVQTFEVTATNPTQVIDHFREELPPLGWTEGEAVTDSAPTEPADLIRSSWIREGQTLLVSIADFQEGQDVQFSLQLFPG